MLEARIRKTFPPRPDSAGFNMALAFSGTHGATDLFVRRRAPGVLAPPGADGRAETPAARRAGHGTRRSPPGGVIRRAAARQGGFSDAHVAGDARPDRVLRAGRGDVDCPSRPYRAKRR